MNKENKYEIGGRVRRFVIDFNVMCEFDNLTGLSSLQQNIWQSPSFSTIRALVYCSLKAGDPLNKEITLERVGTWIPMNEAQKIWAFLLEIYVREYKIDIGSEEGEGEGDDKKKVSQ